MPKSRAEINRKYYAKRTAHIERRHCSECGKRLYSISKELCRACWLKTDDGREYLRLKKIESRAKKTCVMRSHCIALQMNKQERNDYD